jgi:hypothetical protein
LYQRGTMADASLSENRLAERDFEASRIINRTFSILSRNLLPFCLVAAVAHLPNLSLFRPTPGVVPTIRIAVLLFTLMIAVIVLSALAEAIVLFGVLEDMRGRRVDISASMHVGLSRLMPVLSVALLVAFLIGFSAILLILPAFIALTMLFVAVPACIVEQLGPVNSLKRSSRLTKGHRWKIFGLWFLVMVVSGIGDIVPGVVGLSDFSAVALILELVWGSLTGAFGAVMVAVIYHDLRVTKEGIDTNQIASVFE